MGNNSTRENAGRPVPKKAPAGGAKQNNPPTLRTLHQRAQKEGSQLSMDILSVFMTDPKFREMCEKEKLEEKLDAFSKNRGGEGSHVFGEGPKD